MNSRAWIPSQQPISHNFRCHKKSLNNNSSHLSLYYIGMEKIVRKPAIAPPEGLELLEQSS